PALARALPRTASERLPAYADKLTVVAEDALRVDAVPGEPPTALVANLPYNVAVPVLLNLLERLPSLRHGLVMVQAEVAHRLLGGHGYALASRRVVRDRARAREGQPLSRGGRASPRRLPRSRQRLPGRVPLRRGVRRARPRAVGQGRR